jgi:tetratricopeptide (TPR) repeat protein
MRLADLQLRHAELYCRKLCAIEGEMQQDASPVDRLMEQLRAAVAQIQTGQEWAARSAATNEAAAELCWRYASASRFSTDGDSVVELITRPQVHCGWLESALKCARRDNNSEREGLCLYGLGCTRLKLYDPKAAIELLTSALPLFETAGNRLNYGITVFEIAAAHSYLGQHRRAIGLFEEAIGIFASIGSTWEATAQLSLGATYDVLGEVCSARSAYERGLRLFEEAQDPARTISVLVQLGRISLRANDIDAGQKYLRDAVSLLRERGHGVRHGYYTTSLADAGLSLAGSGDSSGVELIEEDLRHFRELRHRVGEGFTLIALGTARMALGASTTAGQVFDEALTIFRDLSDGFGEAVALHQLARVELLRNNAVVAVTLCDQASRLFEACNHPRSRAAVLWTGSRAMNLVGRRAEAMELAAEALEVLEALGHSDATKVKAMLRRWQSSTAASEYLEGCEREVQ